VVGNNGLRLQTATVTNDLYSAHARSHRIQGPTSAATIELDFSGMNNGDRAGLALLRDSSAWIGVKRDGDATNGGATKVAMVNGLTMDSNWNTTGTGSEAASAHLRRPGLATNQADIRSRTGRQGQFFYSTDGVNCANSDPASRWATTGASSCGLPVRHLRPRHEHARRRMPSASSR
jgi:beta-xylosidase